MKNLSFTLALALLSFVVGLVLCGAIMPATVDSSSLHNLDTSMRFSVLHLSYNSYLSWQINSSIAALGQLLEGSFSQRFDNGAVAVLGALFISGLVLLLRYLRQMSWFDLLFPSSFLLACIYWIWGSDIVLFSMLAVLPWLVLALLLALRDKRSQLSALLFLLLVSLLLCSVAQQFTIFVMLAAICLAILLANAFELTLRLEARQQKWIIALSLLLPLVVVLELRQESFLPQYPNDSHVVSDDNVAGQVTPLVGEAPSVPLVNRKFVRGSYGDLSLVLLSVVGAMLLLLRRNPAVVRLGLFSAGSLLIVALDTALPEAYAQIMPLFSASRVVPGAMLYPLAPFFLATALIGIVLLLYRVSHLFLAAALVCMAVSLAGFNGVQKRAVIEKIEAAKLRDAFLQLSDVEQAKVFAVVFSPSFNLLTREGLAVVLQPQRYQAKDFRPLSEAELLELTDGATTNPVQLFDKNNATRWSSRGGQRGGEEFCLAFSGLQRLSGIELGLGSFTSDFPRGIEVVKVADCKDSTGEIVFSRPHWEGPVRYTQEGFPYWGWQADVGLIFERDVVAQNLKVRQIGKNKNFDWSVTEVKFYTAAGS